MDARKRIIAAVAEAACQRVIDRTVAALQTQPSGLSGDDSELRNVWDEFCVQAQEEESFFWDAYRETAEQLIYAELEALPRHELEAIWLQTDRGWDWLYDLDPDSHSDTTSEVPCDTSETAHYVFGNYLMRRAEEFSNDDIEAYLERVQKDRHELDELPQEDSDRGSA